MAPTFVPDPSTIQEHGRNQQSFVVEMHPSDFLDASYKQTKRETEEDYLRGRNVYRQRDRYDFASTSPETGAELIYRMEQGLPIEAPHLFVEDAAEIKCPNVYISDPKERKESCKIRLTGDGKITGHEGRNRSTIAEFLGINYIPIRIDVDGLKDWYENEKIYNNSKLQKRLLQNVGINAITRAEMNR